MEPSTYLISKRTNWLTHYQVKLNKCTYRESESSYTNIGHAMTVRSLCFASDSKTLISGSDDKCVHVYDVEHGQLASSLTGHSDWVLCVAANPDISKQQIVSCSSDKKIKVWDLGLRSVLETHEVHSDQVMFYDWAKRNKL